MPQTATDLEQLWSDCKGARSEDARRQLVEQYIGLVKFVAGRLAVGLPHYLEFTDLYGAGLVGLIQAVDHFDPSRGIKFETYAIPRIRGAILDELRAQDWFPRSVRRKARQVEEAYATLEMRLGRAATDEEVANHLGIELREFDRMVGEISVATIVSLDTEVNQEDGSGGHTMVETIEDPNARMPEEDIAEREMRDVVAKGLGDLPDKERLVLTLYYYEELTLREIGEVLDVTESRICQIHTKAVFRLRGIIQRRTTQKPLERLGEEVAAVLSEKVRA